ncbi:MAG: transposase domain-containing protein [Thalassobaculaceae bacterium]
MSWYSAAALADLALPGLPSTKRGVQELAKAEAWLERFDSSGAPLARKRRGRGGGYEFHLSLLPTTARAKLLTIEEQEAADTPKAANKGAATEAWQRYDRLTEKQKNTAQQRAAIMDEVSALERGGSSMTVAIAHVARRHDIGASTLREWFRLVDGVPRTDWPAFVAPRYVGRTATAECSTEAWDMLVTLYLRSSKAPFSTCYHRVAEAAEEHGWIVPPERTLKRRLDKEIPRTQQILARKGREAFERTKPAQRRDRSVFKALEAVNADGHKVDVFVKIPGQKKPGRAVVVVFQDLYSGKILSWRLALTENVDAVRLAYGDLVTRWGIPSHIYIDNGKAFAAKDMTGQTGKRYRFKVMEDEAQGIFGQFGTEVHFTTPYRGQSKPIERAFRDFCDTIAKHPRFVGAYTGNSPTNKPFDYGARAVELDELQAVIEQEVIRHNARPGRRAATCKGRSFDETFAESYEIQSIRKAGPEMRRQFLLRSKLRPTHRVSGEITFMGNAYWAEPLTQWAGKKVLVRYDPADLHGGISVYTRRNEFICEAPCAQAAGFNNSDDARDHTRANKARLKAERQQLEANRRMGLDDAVSRLATIELPEDPKASVIQPDFTRRPVARAVGDGLEDDTPGFLDRIAGNVTSIADKRRRRL